VASLWNEFVRLAYQHLAEEGKIDPESEPAYSEHPKTRHALIPIEDHASQLNFQSR
jgi:hypothetical protein